MASFPQGDALGCHGLPFQGKDTTGYLAAGSVTDLPFPTRRARSPPVDASQRLQHTIVFTDESTPTRRAKPAGVIGAEMTRAATVRERVLPVDGPPPVDPGELEFLAVNPVTPAASRAGARDSYTRDDAGAPGRKRKPAHYMLRWVNSRGKTGPWSETATVTVGA